MNQCKLYLHTSVSLYFQYLINPAKIENHFTILKYYQVKHWPTYFSSCSVKFLKAHRQALIKLPISVKFFIEKMHSILVVFEKLQYNNFIQQKEQ